MCSVVGSVRWSGSNSRLKTTSTLDLFGYENWFGLILCAPSPTQLSRFFCEGEARTLLGGDGADPCRRCHPRAPPPRLPSPCRRPSELAGQIRAAVMKVAAGPPPPRRPHPLAPPPGSLLRPATSARPARSSTGVAHGDAGGCSPIRPRFRLHPQPEPPAMWASCQISNPLVLILGPLGRIRRRRPRR